MDTNHRNWGLRGRTRAREREKKGTEKAGNKTWQKERYASKLGEGDTRMNVKVRMKGKENKHRWKGTRKILSFAFTAMIGLEADPAQSSPCQVCV